MFSILAVVAVCVGTVTFSSRPATASVLGNDRARANQLLKQINRISSKVDFLGQMYDLAQVKLHKITFEIKNTKAEVATIKSNVKKSAKELAADAVFAYVTNGSAAGNNPLFADSASKIGSTNVYSQLAEGNITSTISNLKSYRIELTQERSILANEVGKATNLARAAAASFHSANVYQASLNHSLSEVKGSIATYIAQAQAAANAATVTQFNSATLTDGMTNPPPDSMFHCCTRRREVRRSPSEPYEVSSSYLLRSPASANRRTHPPSPNGVPTPATGPSARESRAYNDPDRSSHGGRPTLVARPDPPHFAGTFHN